jgi:hypothetical protein
VLIPRPKALGEPDFYLTSAGESYELASPRSCRIMNRLRDRLRDDHLLIEISPPLVGQRYGLGDRDITKLLLSPRLEGFCLSPVNEWPCYVYVSRILDETIANTLFFTADQVQLIAWATIFPTLAEANSYFEKV